MKSIIYIAVAAIAALSSCSGNDDIVGESGPKAAGATEFTATIEGNETTTRTSYNPTSMKAEWLTTDEINVNGAVYKATTAGATTTFIGEGAMKSDNHYSAYYPATIFSDDKLTLPAEYAYDGNFNMPMYAVSETNKLHFMNLCGVLAITVQSSQISSVKSIVVSSDKQMNGQVTGMTDNALLFHPTCTAENQIVTLTFSEPKAITSNETFYIPVPPMSGATLAITIEVGENTYTMTTKSGKVNVERSKIYPITFNAPLINGHQYVVLAGLKWATENVTASPSMTPYAHDDKYGDYFGQDSTHGTSAKEAAESWGGTWKLPTEEQWQALIDNCDWAWMDKSTENGKYYPAGVWVTGKNGTEVGNKMFLPAAGTYEDINALGQGHRGDYWSSDKGLFLGDYLLFNNKGQRMRSNLTYTGMSVRPVSE